MTQYLVESSHDDWKELLAPKVNRIQDIIDKIDFFKQEIDKKYYLIWDCKPFLCKNTFKDFTGLDPDVTKYLPGLPLNLTCEVKIKIKFTKQHTLEVVISRDMFMFPYEQARLRLERNCNEKSELLLQEFDDRVNQTKQQLTFYKCWKDITLIAFQQNGHPQDFNRDKTYSVQMRNSNKRRIKIGQYLQWLKLERSDIDTIIESFLEHKHVVSKDVFQKRGYGEDERRCVFVSQCYPEIPWDRDDTDL
jgi:hypothetical protein